MPAAVAAGALASHYSRFRVSERLLLSGHSHQAWPDVAIEGQLEAFNDAALHVDEKWGRAFDKAERLRDGIRTHLEEPQAEIALGASTFELVTRFLSALDLKQRPRLVSTDGEFHTLRRLLSRLSETELEIHREPAEPAETLAERLAQAADERTAAVLVSAVLFETSRIVPHLGELADHCAKQGTELLVDAYHALGALPFPLAAQGLETAWIVGGGYKYLQLGEGNCFLRLPPQADELRPLLTGWFAEFAALADEADPTRVAYGRGGARYAGSTYDPTSNYRAARVLDFFAEQGLTADALRASYLRQTTLLSDRFDALGLPDELVTRDRDTPRSDFGGFLALRSPHAAELQQGLTQRGVQTDSRGRYLRLGPAPYLTDEQLEAAIEQLDAVARAL